MLSNDPGSLVNKLLNILITIATTLGVIYVLALVLLYFYQGRLIYLPNIPSRALQAKPTDINLPYQVVHLETQDNITLHAWFVPKTDAKGVVLFCHGNAGNISHRLDSIRIFNQMGLAVLIFDYRGYGESELTVGEIDERGTYQDVQAAWQYLRQSYKPDQIVLFGRSLGGGVATELATLEKPAALILESTFSSVPKMGSELYPFLPIKLLSRIRYDSLSKMARIKTPILFLHSPDDDLIPYSHGRALFSAAQEPKQFFDLRGNHNSGFLLTADYPKVIKAFLQKYMPI